MKKRWDKVGITLSSICLIHCFCIVLLPLIFPFISSYIHSIWVHITFSLLVIALFPLAFIPGYRRHKSQRVLVIAFFAVIFLLAGIISEPFVSDWISHGLSVVGSVSVIGAHLLNIRLQRKYCLSNLDKQILE